MKFGATYLVTSQSPGIWPRISKELGLPVDVIIEHARALMDRLPDAFADAAREPSVVATRSTMPGRLVDAVADRIRRSKVSTL
jgi:hypothetical protein